MTSSTSSPFGWSLPYLVDIFPVQKVAAQATTNIIKCLQT